MFILFILLYFASKFTVPSAPDEALPPCCDFGIGTLSRMSVTPFRIAALLSSVDKSKSCGPDGLSAVILKECADILSNPLSIIFNKCLTTGIFPEKWKEANIIPVHKKGRRDLASNYRSISLLPLISKVFEKVVCDVFISHIRPVISDSQHGFVSKRSCVTNLCELLAHATSALEDKQQLDIIYTDFSSAFQSVDHRLLLHKLENSYGISGPVLSLFRSYFMNRRQRVLVNGLTSGWSQVLSGVAEGSRWARASYWPSSTIFPTF